MKTIVLLLAALTLRGAEVEGMMTDGGGVYDNAFEGPVNVNCDCGYALYKVYSVFGTNDRRWRWECIQVYRSTCIMFFVSVIQRLALLSHADQRGCKRRMRMDKWYQCSRGEHGISLSQKSVHGRNNELIRYCSCRQSVSHNYHNMALVIT